MRASRPALVRWFAWAQQEPTLEATRARASASEESFDAGIDFKFVLVETDTDELVGMLRVNPASGPEEAEIGYWVRSDRQGRGTRPEPPGQPQPKRSQHSRESAGSGWRWMPPTPEALR